MNLRITINKGDDNRIKQDGYGAGKAAFEAGFDKAMSTLTAAQFSNIWQDCAGKGEGAITVEVDGDILTKMQEMADKFGVSRNKIGRAIVHLGLPEPDVQEQVQENPLQTELDMAQAELQEAQAEINKYKKTLRWIEYAINSGKETGTVLFTIKRTLQEQT